MRKRRGETARSHHGTKKPRVSKIKTGAEKADTARPKFSQKECKGRTKKKGKGGKRISDETSDEATNKSRRITKREKRRYLEDATPENPRQRAMTP